MNKLIRMLGSALVMLSASGGPAFAQAIENELVLITPVARTLTDPALADFAKYAKERWNIDVKTGRRHAGGLRPHRRVEGPARCRHLLGRRKRAL
jgi:hypothetical protein